MSRRPDRYQPGKHTLEVVERPTKNWDITLAHGTSPKTTKSNNESDPLQIPKICFPAESNGIFRADGKKTLSSSSDFGRPSAQKRKSKSSEPPYGVRPYLRSLYIVDTNWKRKCSFNTGCRTYGAPQIDGLVSQS